MRIEYQVFFHETFFGFFNLIQSKIMLQNIHKAQFKEFKITFQCDAS